MEDQVNLKKVPLNDLHVSLGAKMVPFAGYLMPVRYSSDIEEHKTVRNGVGVFDVSHMGEFLVEGPKALDLVQQVSTNDASRLKTGKAQYSCLTNEKGGIIDDLLVYKLEEEKYLLVVNASNIKKDWDWIDSKVFKGVSMKNISAETALFAVQGPKAQETLQKITEVNLSEIPFYAFTTGEIGGVKEVIISATGYTGAGGFELYVHKRDAEKLWKEIFKAGEIFSIKPIGLGARDTLRLEMGYCLYGNDIDDETTPLEAGLSWITKFTKEFTASELLKEQKAEGIKRKLVGFEMIDKGIPRSKYEILNKENKKIGEVRSGTQSPELQKGIGLGYVESSFAKEGTEVLISIRNRTLLAKIVKLPFIKK